jgi:hypothetical protein
MYSIPEHIRETIVLNSIILEKNRTGWKEIHFQLKNSKVFLKQTDYIFVRSLEYEMVVRMPSLRLIDVFSMDETGNYLDDMCDEIMYW